MAALVFFILTAEDGLLTPFLFGSQLTLHIAYIVSPKQHTSNILITYQIGLAGHRINMQQQKEQQQFICIPNYKWYVY